MSELLPVHEHIVEVARAEQNNGLLSKEELWAEVEYFVRHPDEFIESLEGCSVTQQVRNDGVIELTRALDFGAFKLEDTVCLFDTDRAVTSVQESEMIPSSEFEIKIEEPEQGSLFMRFTYKEAFRAGLSDNAQIQNLRIQAWEDKDVRTVEKMMERLLARKTQQTE